jgi:adenylylsulfate reductase subunit B
MNMSIRINRKKCVGCGKCTEVCPGTLIALEEKKAVMKYPKDCWGCVSCVKECQKGAIEFFLGADIGGNGSVMTVETVGDILQWKITKSDKSVTTIDVNRKNSNKY